jgi:hypothetical protein
MPINNFMEVPPVSSHDEVTCHAISQARPDAICC